MSVKIESAVCFPQDSILSVISVYSVAVRFPANGARKKRSTGDWPVDRLADCLTQ